MTLWTAQEFYTKVKNDLDLNDEQFITSDEFEGYLNAGINRAEQLIHGIYEDYFLESANLSLTTDSSLVTFPTNIFAHKIRTISYVNGETKYEITRLRDIKQLPYIDSNSNYRYMITNTLAAGPQIKIYPASRETSSTNVTAWFIRNAKVITDAADTVDIPEAQNFILTYMKVQCLAKEMHPNLTLMAQQLEKEEQELIGILSGMVPDEDTNIRMDQSLIDDEYYS